MAETDTNSIQYICYTPCAGLEFHKHIKNIAVADVPRQGSTRDLPLSDCTLSMSPIDKQFLLGLPHSAVSNGYKEEEWMPNKTPHPTGISSTNSNQQRPCRAGGWAQRSPQNPESNTKRNMTVKINDTICPVRQDESTKLYYVDLDGQATSGASTDELLQKLRERYTSVSVYSEASE